MSNKKFGVGSMDKVESDNKKESNFIEKKEVTEKKTETIKKFGVDINQTVESETKIQPDSTLNVAQNMGTMAKNLFSGQSGKFWILAYLMSGVYYYTMANTISGFVGFFNVILFPFAILLIGDFSAHYLGFSQTVADFFYPTYKLGDNDWRFVGIIIWYVLKFMFFSFVWLCSSILGVISIVVLLARLKKMRK